MKAAVFSEPGAPLTVESVADPEPGPADLILKVHACGICGTDLHWSDNADPSVGWRHLERGAVMGHEFSGEVVEVGKDAGSGWKIGDRVTAQPFSGCGRCPACLAGRAYRCQSVTNRASLAQPGAYAEYTRVGANASFRLPEAASFDEGALVEPLAVGLNAVEKARMQPGDTVLIVGAGPVGLAVATWCRFSVPAISSSATWCRHGPTRRHVSAPPPPSTPAAKTCAARSRRSAAPSRA